MAREIRKVAIVGAGVMGIQIALRAARKAGNKISLTDISSKAIESSKARQEQALSDMVQTRAITESEKGLIKELITFTPDLAECLKGADLVIEAIVEELQLKRDLFVKLDDLAPADAVLATNSSTIPISRIEDVTGRRDKVLNIHFYEPELIPMVDVMGGTRTSEETMVTAEKWAREIDCVPIRLKKEILGFCMNHLWHAARIEALKMWADGYVEFQDIDRAWMIFLHMPLGPFGLMDRIGLDTVYNVHAYYYAETKDVSKKPPDKLREMIDRGDLGIKTGKGFLLSCPGIRRARLLEGIGVIMPNQVEDGYLVTKAYAWYVYSLIFILMLFDYIDRQVVASLFPFLKTEWSLSDVQCGMLVAALNWSITIFAFPVGLLADRWSRKKTVGLMSTIWSLGTLACAFPQSFHQLFATRFLVGTGEAGYVPVGCALISALFPHRLRSRLIGVFMGAGTLGSAIGVALGGWIATHWGWRHAFGIVGVPGLIFAVMFFFVRDYKTVELTIAATQAKGASIRRNMTSRDVMTNLFGRRSVLALYSVSVTGFFFLGAVAAWLPTFFIRVGNLPVAEASAKTGLSVVVCIFGNYLVGHITDRVVRRGLINGYPLMAAASQLCSGLLYGIAFILAEGQAQFFLLILAGTFLTAFVSPAYSALSELVHPGLRSSVISVNVLLLNALGFSTGPIVAGALSDSYGIGTAMIVLSFVPLISMMMAMVAAGLYGRDLAKVEKVELQVDS